MHLYFLEYLHWYHILESLNEETGEKMCWYNAMNNGITAVKEL